MSRRGHPCRVVQCHCRLQQNPVPSFAQAQGVLCPCGNPRQRLPGSLTATSVDGPAPLAQLALLVATSAHYAWPPVSTAQVCPGGGEMETSVLPAGQHSGHGTPGSVRALRLAGSPSCP